MNSAQLTAFYTRWCARRNAKKKLIFIRKQINGWIKEVAEQGNFNLRVDMSETLFAVSDRINDLRSKGFEVINKEDNEAIIRISWL